MRICYLSNANNYHTIKWCRWFSQRGNRVLVLSLDRCTNKEMLSLEGVEVHWLKNPANRDSGGIAKLAYLATAPQARREIRKFQPDVLHAHYASSYGLVAALAAEQDYYLSVWGSDVYEFPAKSPLHRAAIKYALRRARWVMSTSEAMAKETSKYTGKEFYITPFGVDMDMFSPTKRSRTEGDGRFVVGTVKALEPKYGIDVLLRGAARAVELRPDIPLEVRIAGKGSQQRQLESLALELGIVDRVHWLGFIPQEQAAQEWADMDVAVVMSERESESFGVSSVEAQACGTPVIYSDIPGLMEAAGGGRIGICLRRSDTGMLAQEMIRLYDQSDLRFRLGDEGRDFASKTFGIDTCFERVEAIYIHNINGTGEFDR